MNKFVAIFVLFVSFSTYALEDLGTTNLNNPIVRALGKGIPVLVKFEMGKGCPPCEALNKVLLKTVDKSSMEIATIDLLKMKKTRNVKFSNCSIYDEFGNIESEIRLYSKFTRCLYRSIGTPSYFFLNPANESILSLKGNNPNKFKYSDLINNLVKDGYNTKDSLNASTEVLSLLESILTRSSDESSVQLSDIYNKMKDPRMGESEVKDGGASLVDLENDLRGFEMRLKEFEVSLNFRESDIKFKERNIKIKEQAYKDNLKKLIEKEAKLKIEKSELEALKRRLESK